LENSLLSQESVSYLEKKNEKSHLWVKAYMKVSFTGGTCTTSRIEAKHRIFKKFLNSGSSLQKIFETFAKLEKMRSTITLMKLKNSKKTNKTLLNSPICSKNLMKSILHMQ